MTTSEKFELEAWIKEQKEIHFPASRKPFNTAPDRAFELGLDWGFEKAKELYEPRWIAVSDDYPEFGVLVLVSFCGIVSYGRWDGFLWTVNDEPEHSLMKIDRIRFVTHWMLLPQAPQPTEVK